jgi:hypothetical protein
MPSTSEPTPLDPRLAVLRSNGQFQVVALAPIARGETLLYVNGRVVDRPSRYSVQIGAHEHVDPPVPDDLADDMDRHAWRFLNHSCEPNAVLRGRTLVAQRDIARGDEVTFDYATTEYEMAEPFACGCGAARCRGLIRGFTALTAAQQQELAPQLAPHLHARAAELAPAADRISSNG